MQRIPFRAETRSKTFVRIDVSHLKCKLRNINSRKIIHEAYGTLAGTTRNVQ
jgi:hypothetical protein